MIRLRTIVALAFFLTSAQRQHAHQRITKDSANRPQSCLAVDSAGNVYGADTANDTIWKNDADVSQDAADDSPRRARDLAGDQHDGWN
jgi:hypothetical protein